MATPTFRGMPVACANCRLALVAPSDGGRFACRYCGALQAVAEGNRPVVLRTIPLASETRSEPDVLAADVALHRLGLELDAVQAHYRDELARLRPAWFLALALVATAAAALIAWIGPLLGALTGIEIGIVLLVAGVCAARERASLTCAYLAAKSRLQREIHHQLRIANRRPPEPHGR